MAFKNTRNIPSSQNILSNVVCILTFNDMNPERFGLLFQENMNQTKETRMVRSLTI